MVDWRAWGVVGALLATGCGDGAAEAPAPPPRTPSEASGGAAGGGPIVGGGEVRFEVNDATVADAVRELSQTTGTTVVIDPNAQAVADCARITVATARPVSREDLLEVVRLGLSPTGITLEEVPEGLILRRNVEAPLPATCRPQADTPGLSSGGGEDDAEERERRQAALEAGIRRRSDTEFLITEEAAANLAEAGAMARTARIIPHMEDGEVVGLKVYGIRRSSPLGMLGILNGDQIRSVNGHDLSNPEAALEAYSRLRGQDRYTVRIVRRGQPMEITYRIVPRLP